MEFKQQIQQLSLYASHSAKCARETVSTARVEFERNLLGKLTHMREESVAS
jgi:hypothetical protein